MSTDTCIVSILPDKIKVKIDGKSREQIRTPFKIAYEMVEVVCRSIPDDKWNKDLKILDFYCKSGVFLKIFADKLFEKTRHLYNNDKECMEHILKHQLFGIAADKLSQALATRALYGGLVSNSNIKYIEHFEELVKLANPKLLYDRIKETFSEVYSNIEIIDKEGNYNMKGFGVVIGNPPYNNDAYLDFVDKGHKLSSNLTCMITPAKWQAKGGEKNEVFRRDIVPYMEKIVFYPETDEIFDIREASGISYYILANKVIKNKLVRTQCVKNKFINSDFEIHDEECVKLSNRNILSIIGKVGTLGGGFKQSLYVKNTDHGEETIAGTLGFKRQVFTGEQERGEAIKQAGYAEVMQGEKVVGYKKISELYTTDNLDKWKITTSVMAGNLYLDDKGLTLGIVPCNIIKPYQVPKGSYPVLKYFDTEEECKSFKSYYESRLVSFLFYIGACGTTLTKEFFRFIPDPGTFDHIFTDDELYKKYNITEEEQNIIESVIKERK